MVEHIRASLLDRLVDDDPYTGVGTAALKTIDKKELKESIHREISWLLNTLCPCSQDEMEREERNTLNYGVHDFSGFFPDNSENRLKLGKILREVIEAFEPRLENVEVYVEEMNDRHDRFTLSVIIRSTMVTDEIREPVTFVMAIE